MKVRRSDLKRRSVRRDDGDAFVPDPAGRILISLFPDEAEAAAEEFIVTVTTADFVLEDSRNELSIDEVGGAFSWASLSPPTPSAWPSLYPQMSLDDEEDLG